MACTPVQPGPERPETKETADGQTANISIGDLTVPAISAGTIKIPEPTTPPITIEVTSNRPKTRGN